MRVLLLSKALILGAYRRKLEPLAAQGIDLTVVVPPYWQDDAGRRVILERETSPAYRLVVEPMAFNGHFHYHFYPRLARRFREVRPDLVHIEEEPYNLATAQALWLARRYGARTIFFSWQNLYRRYPPPFSWIERYVYARSVGAIAGNREVANVLRRKGFRERTWIIPQFGVDPAIFYRRDTGDGGSRPFTVGSFTGRLHERKGMHLLVEAVAALQDDTRLEILGWGPEEARLRRLAAERGLGDRFRIHPPVPSYQVPEFASRLDVAVMPSLTIGSWKEQFGRMLIEAMACEVAVVGSDSGEIPNVIGDAGLIFAEGDVAALTDCLRRLRDDAALRRELASRGVARVRARFTQEQIGRQTAAAYREALASAG